MCCRDAIIGVRDIISDANYGVPTGNRSGA